jgi:DNA-binding protein YbaB
MLPEWQAHIDELLERYREKRDRLRDLQGVVAGAGATVTTADEMITVTVGPHGRLAGLALDPRVYRKLSPSELAAAVLVAAGEAGAQVDGQVRAALADMRTGGPAGSDDAPGSTQPGRPAAPVAEPGTTGAAGPGVPTGPGVLNGSARPDGSGRGADGDVARILPERPDDLDAFRERYGLRAGPGDS